MKLYELLYEIDYKTGCALDTPISGISYDSRSTKEGDLFFAVPGLKTDGFEYIGAAMAAGAAAVICERTPTEEVPYVLVASVREALAKASCNFYGNPASAMTMIGVTGTNGKTTFTYIMKSILEETVGAKVGLIGTNQNMIGDAILETERTTPESYELQRLLSKMRGEGCTHVVMEVSSHALYLKRVFGIRYDIGVFTNLTQDHLDFHGTMDEYLKAKSLLFKNCRTGIINLDDAVASYIIENAECEVFTFSAKKIEADLVAKNIKLRQDRVEFEGLTKAAISRVEMGIPGEFSLYNALSALASGIALGISLPAAAAAIKNIRGVKGRFEVCRTDTDYTVIIDYAHTPDALENILKAVRGVAEGRVVLLFGCGGDRDAAKRPLMGKIAVSMADFVIVTSDNPRTEDPNRIIDDIAGGMGGYRTPFVIITDRREAIKYALLNAQPKDLIILAGKGHETYQIIGTEKTHFDEREEVFKILKASKHMEA